MLHLPNNCRSSNPTLTVKANGIWYIDFRFYNDQGQSKRIQIKAGLNRIKDLKERRKIAAELIKATIEQLKSGVNYITNTAPQQYEGELTPATPFADALNLAVKRLDIEHATSLDIHSMLRYFTPSCKAINAAALPIGKVTRREVVLALNHATANKSAKTFNRYRKYLMILFKYLVEIMAVDVNPVRDISIKSTVTTVKETLSHTQRKQIDRHLKAKGLHTFRLFNRIFFTSGSRITELLRLRAKDINLVGQWYLVTIKKGKNKRQVKKTISNYAIEYWRYALRNANKEDYIFSKGLKPGIKPITAAQLTRRWEIHVKLGLGITADFYSNRHASATQIADNYSQQIAADHLQHTSKAMVRKIYDVSAEDRRHEAAKLVRVVY